MLEVDCSILTPELVLKASGHLSKFSDIMLRDVVTNDSFRADHLIKAELEKTIKKSKSNKSINVEEAKQTMIKIENGQFSNLNEIDDIVRKYKIKSPTTGNELSNATPFNLMFQTQIGPCGSTKGFLFDLIIVLFVLTYLFLYVLVICDPRLLKEYFLISSVYMDSIKKSSR